MKFFDQLCTFNIFTTIFPLRRRNRLLISRLGDNNNRSSSKPHQSRYRVQNLDRFSLGLKHRLVHCLHSFQLLLLRGKASYTCFHSEQLRNIWQLVRLGTVLANVFIRNGVVCSASFSDSSGSKWFIPYKVPGSKIGGEKTEACWAECLEELFLVNLIDSFKLKYFQEKTT